MFKFLHTLFINFLYPSIENTGKYMPINHFKTQWGLRGWKCTEELSCLKFLMTRGSLYIPAALKLFKGKPIAQLLYSAPLGPFSNFVQFQLVRTKFLRLVFKSQNVSLIQEWNLLTFPMGSLLRVPYVHASGTILGPLSMHKVFCTCTKGKKKVTSWLKPGSNYDQVGGWNLALPLLLVPRTTCRCHYHFGWIGLNQ